MPAIKAGVRGGDAFVVFLGNEDHVVRIVGAPFAEGHDMMHLIAFRNGIISMRFKKLSLAAMSLK